MKIAELMANKLEKFFQEASLENIKADTYKDLCGALHVTKMYYDIDLGGDDRYRNQRTGKLVFEATPVDDKLVLYDSGMPGGLKKCYNFYYDGNEYVHAYIEFEKAVKEDDIDQELCAFMANVIYIIISRQNMRKMLDYAETSDVLTGIPNIAMVQRKYYTVLQHSRPQDYAVLRINLRNFRYINEICGAQAGDEAIIQYSRKLLKFTEDDECAGRMGGDNFVVYLHNENLKNFLKKISTVTISKLKNAPNNRFDVVAWVGISMLSEDENKTFLERLNDANVACGLGKSRLKQDVVYYGEGLKNMVMQGRDIIGIFPTAVKNHEFTPFFQPKVDMKTGKLVGFEALCRWFHEDHYIYPDQFIPILDREGLIPKLDLAIFDETCKAIKRWKEMGLTPPRISSNFSRKDLFVPKIESKILKVIEENGLSTDDVEIEITESTKDVEYERLITFVKTLKANGLFISIDDFGTGYSSLSLLHNIDADVIKIDKSFTDMITADDKTAILVESIITIAQRLKMEIIAEGVETKEQGKKLVELGCNLAQGYYYSKPVDYQSATEIINSCDYAPVV